jgi:hypothetical protein
MGAGFAAQENWLLLRNLYSGAPGKPHAQLMAARNQERMELQTANANADAALEMRCCVVVAGKECDALEGYTVMGRGLDTKRCQVSACIRHQPFAAGLIDGRLRDRRVLHRR